MNQRQIKISMYPKMIQEFAIQNLNLKILCSALLAITGLMLVLVLYLVKKGPIVIALDNTGEVARIETKITDLQIQAAVKEYISYRYNWNDLTVGPQLKRAEFFVLPSLVTAFRKSMIEVQKYVHEKKVNQRVYPRLVRVDLKEKKVAITADRITEFESLKAASEMKLVLQFDIDDRSVVNPWGIYITKESEGGIQ